MRTISEKERFFINIARGVAVFLMLWGHCIQYLTAESGLDFFENSVFKFIYSFHMPLFMILSGYLFFYSFQKRDLKELLIHRVQSLAFPIVFGSIFIWLTTDVFFAVINGNYGVIFDGGWIYKLPSLWFLWSVLVSSIMVAICVKKITNVWGQIACLVLSSGAIVFFPNAMLNLYMYPYFVIGFCFAKCREKMPTWMIRCRYLSILAFPFLLFFYEKKHYIYTTGLFGNGYSLVDAIIIDLYRWLIGFTGSVFVMVVLEIIGRLFALHTKKLFVSRAIAKAGIKSLQLYVLSVPFLSIYLSKIFPLLLEKFRMQNIFTQNMFVFNFLFTFGIAIVYAIVLYWVTKLLEKLKVGKVIFGR